MQQVSELAAQAGLTVPDGFAGNWEEAYLLLGCSDEEEQQETSSEEDAQEEQDACHFPIEVDLDVVEQGQEAQAPLAALEEEDQDRSRSRSAGAGEEASFLSRNGSTSNSQGTVGSLTLPVRSRTVDLDESFDPNATVSFGASFGGAGPQGTGVEINETSLTCALDILLEDHDLGIALEEERELRSPRIGERGSRSESSEEGRLMKNLDADTTVAYSPAGRFSDGSGTRWSMGNGSGSGTRWSEVERETGRGAGREVVEKTRDHSGEARDSGQARISVPHKGRPVVEESDEEGLLVV